MSLNKNTKAELLEMLSSKGIDAKPSIKRDELIELLGNTVEPTLEETMIEASASEGNTKSNTKPSASQPVFLVVGVFIVLAILAWIIL
ncbi:hypothetical protein N9L08_09065 [Rhodobacteraceae bacterium]|nr:hypothetical protein [Paracoccaceae bacterium]